MLLLQGRLTVLLASLDNVKRHDPILLSIDETVLGVLHSLVPLSTGETWTYYKQSSIEPSRWSRDWSTSAIKRGWELVQKIGCSERILSMSINIWWEDMKNGAMPFSVVPSARVWGNEHKLKHRKCHVNIRKWAGFPKYVSMGLFRTWLDIALGNLLLC